MNRLFAVLVIAGFLLIPTSLLAHHGQAGYDVTQTVTVKGTVTDFSFVNPHCIVSLDVKDDKGIAQKWQGELTSPNHLVRAGWKATTLKGGDEITLTGYRAKTGANSMWITKVLLANGQEMKTGGGN